VHDLREEKMSVSQKVKDFELEIDAMKLNVDFKIKCKVEKLKELESLKRTSFIISLVNKKKL
jgi:hypothetical protein